MTAGDKELSFLDIIVLQRIGPDTTVERFGSKINSSFFEAANILGTLNLKKFVSIEAAMGASIVTVSDAGKMILATAEEKGASEIDALDKGILGIISKGIKDPDKIAEKLNVRGGDLAYHLYKLVKTGHIDYDMRSGRVSVMLTESGFKDADRREGEDEPTEKLGEELAQESAGPVNAGNNGRQDIGLERVRTKLSYYLKRWGKYAVIFFIVLIILLVAVAWVYLDSGK